MDAAEYEVVVADGPHVGDVAVDPGDDARQDRAARGRAAPPMAVEDVGCLGADVPAEALLAGGQHIHAEGLALCLATDLAVVAVGVVTLV